MKINLYQKKVYILVLLLALIVFLFFIKRVEITNYLSTVLIKIGIIKENIVPNQNNESIKKIDGLTYKELMIEGNKLYLSDNYEEALVFLKKAASLENNDRVNRSLYAVYFAMKNYPEAEKAIKITVALNHFIPQNWIEYASFENYYMKASFETVSKIYLDGMKATKDNVDLITSYASYLVENKKNDEAIVYLKKAIVIDPARKNVFQSEIDELNK